MDIFIYNVREESTENNLKRFLKPVLLKLSITSFHVSKPEGKNFAFLTFLRLQDAQNYLQRHGPPSNSHRSSPFPTASILPVNLKYLGQELQCKKSQNEPNPHLLRVLAKEERDRRTKSTAPGVEKLAEPKFEPVYFKGTSVTCGVWSYAHNTLFYEPQLTWSEHGTVKFGERSMILRLDSGRRIDFLYFATLNICAEVGADASLIFSMREAPRFFENITTASEMDVDNLADEVGVMDLNDTEPHKRGPKRNRIPCLDDTHATLAGSCFVYRITIENDLSNLPGGVTIADRFQSLRLIQGMPRIIGRRIDVVLPRETFAHGWKDLQESLSSLSVSSRFKVNFQAQKLAQDAYLPPRTVLKLLPTIHEIADRTSDSICVRSIRKLFNQIAWLGPDSDPTEFKIDELIELLKSNEQRSINEDIPIDQETEKSGNVAMIHRAKITPSSIRLGGPEPETSNRVLRKYPNYHEFFMRVELCEEDGLSLRYNPRVSNKKVYHQRFKKLLRDGINIGGRIYSFLGFSHSSLRAHSIWFMAPFIHEGSLMYDRMIIQDLGDFSMIRSPAKCAARIGQVFSDTRTSVQIQQSAVQQIPDIERNGRVFSDGCGTMSRGLMEKICESLPKARQLKPTVLQIRYQGAKGMIALDSELEGECLQLRPSMVKFDGTTWPDIEICQAAYRPLRMYLNRQFIKILEDMGVEENFFLDLQKKEIDRLRMITDSPINASTFLKRQSIGNSFDLPWFINHLDMIGLDFRHDDFLRNVLEMALLVELRVLKHKTRIPVEKGWHLHGLMDKTGFLKKGEIYCCIMIEGQKKVITGDKLIISRAPALHPGDVQFAKGLMPPDGSPLLEIHNCICFSSQGERDLPSQLSGGDLDGDRYYIMWDENCQPKRTFPPADYTRRDPIDIGRQVNRMDMIEFFIQFMEMDQLGRIAVLHRILADQKEAGTADRICKLLAEIHSIAVDYSKTGIPVDIKQMPRYPPWRPDFEAPGPHVTIEKGGSILFNDDDDRLAEPDDDDDDGFSRCRYYESEKVLGKLYRGIDEFKIFKDIKKRVKNPATSNCSSVINTLWDQIKQTASLFQWEHHLEWARGIREMYEEKVYSIMLNHSEHTLSPVSEVEAFVGNILGKTGAQTRHQRELSTTMKVKFEEETKFIADCIVKDGTQWSDESLERSMACLAASLEQKIVFSRSGSVLSFKYLAAAVCLREVERMTMGLANGVYEA